MFGGNWNPLFTFLTGTQRRGRRRPPPTSFRPVLEPLEDRRVPANLGSIGGHVLIDPTGNGAAAGNPAQAGVTVRLFRDTNNDGVKDTGDVRVASRVTGVDGTYAFNNLAAGRYFVIESVPSGFVRTAPLLSSSYTINLADGQASAGNDFDNFQKLNTGAITGISFQVTHNGVTKTFATLRGHTHQGDTVTVNFTVSGKASAVVTLIAYNAPAPSADRNTASQEVPAQTAGGTAFAPGPHSLTVVLPANYYEVDFVSGAAIAQFGPLGSNIFYGAQRRLLSTDHGGTSPVDQPASIAGHVYTDTDYGGVPDSNSTPIEGVTVTLTGTDSTNQAVTMTTTTDADGSYCFTGLAAGTYTVQIVTPIDYTDESAVTSVSGASASAGIISNMVVTAGLNSVGNDFLELLPLS
jgi:hypothetical protein